MSNDLRPRYNALVEATLKQNRTMELLRVQIEHLRQENARLAAELSASTSSNQILGDELNTGNQAANDEARRLRELLKSHGIDPGG